MLGADSHFPMKIYKFVYKQRPGSRPRLYSRLLRQSIPFYDTIKFWHYKFSRYVPQPHLHYLISQVDIIVFTATFKVMIESFRRTVIKHTRNTTPFNSRTHLQARVDYWLEEIGGVWQTKVDKFMSWGNCEKLKVSPRKGFDDGN